jgi:fructosamine-3-kinase
MPQFKMASDKEDVFKESESSCQWLEQLIEFAALIRGDLRLSNYLVNSENKPCFIGLAVAYPLSEIDQVLMRLYKGFDDRLSSAYDKAFQLKPDWQKHIKL